jgi:hypothetical protein
MYKKGTVYWKVPIYTYFLYSKRLSCCKVIYTSLSGAIPFVSFLSDLMYDQNLFCFGGLSSWSGSPISMMLLMYFQYDCLSAFQKLNSQKACGPDQIPARILRDLADVIAPPLTLIFQKSLDEGNQSKFGEHLGV